MKRLSIIMVSLLLSGGLMAQTAEDALRYSQQNYQGTARSAAMGGAFGALGGDFSSLSINPAGIGVYRSSEFTFTPSIELTQAKNNGITQDKYSFTIGNLGYVATFKPRIEGNNPWKNFNLGFGYNRVNNFRREALMQISGSTNSLLDVFASNSLDVSPDNLSRFGESLAYETFLINQNEQDPGIYEPALGANDRVFQQKNITERGHIGEYVISFGANYNHKLYLGASIGIQDLYYKSTSDYTETPMDGAETDLNEYTFQEFIRTSGVGFNFKFGAIYRPTEEFRLGLAIHTPTFYEMSDEYQNTMTSHFNTQDDQGNYDYQDVSPYGEYDYELETPFRAIVSAAYLFGKKALLSVDYEFVNYSNSKFSDGEDGYNFFGTQQFPGPNDDIKSIYRSTGNLRLGAEYRVNSFLSLRGGYAHYGSPYKSSEINSDASYNTYSLGWGLKHNNFFFDMAYLYSTQDEKYVFYNNGQVAATATNLETLQHQLRMTFGFKF